MKASSKFLSKGELRVLKPSEILSKSFAKKAFAVSKSRFEDMNTSAKLSIVVEKEDKLVMTKNGVIAVRYWLKTFISFWLEMGSNIANQSLEQLTDQDVLEFWNNIRELLKFKKADKLED
jgi:hypothetical protein